MTIYKIYVFNPANDKGFYTISKIGKKIRYFGCKYTCFGVNILPFKLKKYYILILIV